MPQAADVVGLVRAAQRGDEDAFARLVETHMRAVYALAYRMMGDHDDADDVAQETFLRAHRALERFDERYAFYTWLRTIATRVALNELAKRRRRRTEGGETFDAASLTVALSAPDAQEELEADETRERLAAALVQLPDEYRSAIVLRVHEQLSYEEIASALEIPVGTVMSRLSRARGMLRQLLDRPPAPAPTRRRKGEA